MKATISQLIGEKTKEEILKEKELVEKILKEKGYEIINTYFEDFPKTDVFGKDGKTQEAV